MHCLIVAILILAFIVAVLVLAWNWNGVWGVLGVFGGGFTLLWLLAKLGPPVTQRSFRALFRRAAGPMREVRVAVHSVTLAEESDAVPTMLRQFDAWIDEFNEDADSTGFQIEVDEFLTHNEERPDLARYFVDITVSPPESDPDTKWSPHGIELQPVDSEDASSCELHDVTLFDDATGEFREILEFAYEEVSGERRIRLHVGLDPAIREYQFIYAFVNPLDATIEIPDPKWNEEPLSRFKEGVLPRLGKRRPLTTLSLNWLDVEDDDLEGITEFTELEQLALDSAHVSDDGLQQLATLHKLETLLLDNTQIGDAGIAHLAGLKDLKRLFVRNTSVTKDGLAHLREAIPGLRIYH